MVIPDPAFADDPPPPGAAARPGMAPVASPGRRAIDWRSGLLSLLTHLLAIALIFALAHWLGKEPPEAPPAIEVSLAPDPEPPPPPPQPAPQAQPPRPQPPPPPVPRASEDMSQGAGAPAAAKPRELATPEPAQQSAAPRDDRPTPEAARDEAERPPAAAAGETAPPTERTIAPEQAPAEMPAPASAPPILSLPDERGAPRPPAAARSAPAAPTVTRMAPAPAPRAPAAPQPQQQARRSEAPPPSPNGTAPTPAGPLAALYDAYLAAVRDKVLVHRSLLRAYFGASRSSSVKVEMQLDQSGRLIAHGFIASSLNANLDSAVSKMLALSAPFPAPPMTLSRGHVLSIMLLIPLPSSPAEWKDMYP